MPLPYSIPFGFGADSPFARTLRQLLPPGVLWLFEADSILSKSILALSDEFARATGRALDLVEESDPRTATETLDEWERVLGLPDDTVTAVPTTTAGRRLAIVQKLIRQGGKTLPSTWPLPRLVATRSPCMTTTGQPFSALATAGPALDAMARHGHTPGVSTCRLRPEPR
jgi:hypothetical protein